MQLLDSNNYQSVTVEFRDETVTMPVDTGLKLMEYLTSDNAASHVMLTDTEGVQVVVNKHDIRRVSPVPARNNTDLTKLEIDWSKVR